MNDMLHIDKVTKIYRLGIYGGGTIREDLQSWWAKKRGKDDPNTKIGSSAKHISGDRLTALRAVSFDVSSGETLGIIGKNGAGKSTLLKLISGVTSPTEGHICLNGRITSMLEVGTGFHKELTGRENVYLNGAILGMTKAEIAKRFDEIVEFSEVSQFIDTPVKRYSSGMYVKLAFSVAAHLRSEIVIMDEVLAVGDVDFQNKCIAKMNEVSYSEGRTILYVSHNMNTIRQLCRRCIVLNKGELIFDGEVEDAINQYTGTLKLAYGTHFDTLNNRRTDNANRSITVSAINMLGKRTNVFETKESLDIECMVNTTKACDNLQIMLIVFAKDGSRIGMSESNLFSLPSGDMVLRFKFTPMVLPDGDYYTELNVIERNSFGGYDKYEGIMEAFTFHIENEHRLIKGRDWNRTVWGDAFYPHIEIKL